MDQRRRSRVGRNVSAVPLRKRIFTALVRTKQLPSCPDLAALDVPHVHHRVAGAPSLACKASTTRSRTARAPADNRPVTKEMPRLSPFLKPAFLLELIQRFEVGERRQHKEPGPLFGRDSQSTYVS